MRMYNFTFECKTGLFTFECKILHSNVKINAQKRFCIRPLHDQNKQKWGTANVKSFTFTVYIRPLRVVAHGLHRHQYRWWESDKPKWRPIRQMGGWCWTHCWDPIGRGHCSKNCKKPATGHKTPATAKNTLGGSKKQDDKDNYHAEQKAQWKKSNWHEPGQCIDATREKMKVANNNKLKATQSHVSELNLAPSPWQVESRKPAEIIVAKAPNEIQKGKDKVSFLIPT